MSTKDKERIELLQGTLDLLILRTLLPGPAHGHAIAKTIEFNSADVLQVEQEVVGTGYLSPIKIGGEHVCCNPHLNRERPRNARTKT
jgi:hypothetical protein